MKNLISKIILKVLDWADDPLPFITSQAFKLEKKRYVYVTYPAKLRKDLDLINPNWRKEIEMTETAYLELLKEIYLLGVKPGEIYKLIDFKK